MNAVDGASFDAVLVFGASVGDDVSHSEVLPLVVEVAIGVPVCVRGKWRVFSEEGKVGPDWGV